jgi:ribosomal protein S18 acetylase RimI-like enzyme
MEYYLKRCTLEDVIQLREILITTFHDAFASMNNQEDLEAFYQSAYSLKPLSEELKNPLSSCYFAMSKEGNKPIGFIKINFYGAQSEPDHEGSLELERYYVLPAFQGKGVGSMLLNKTFDIARENNLNYLWLGVWEKNKSAIKIYKKRGFRQFGSHDFYVGNDRQTDILMKINLKH